jgi:hypothetical protein
LDVPRPFTYERSTVDAFGWRRPKKPSALTIDELAEALVASGIPGKIDELATAVEAQGKSAEIEKLRAHVRNYQFQEQQPRRALHLRVTDPGMNKFLELVKESGKRVGKE